MTFARWTKPQSVNYRVTWKHLEHPEATTTGCIKNSGFFFCFFLVVIFFLVCLYGNTQNDATKREKIKSKQPSALFFFKASHHLLIKERLSKPASADHSSLQENPREELAWIALKTNRSNTTRENLKNVYGIMYLSLWWFIPQDECIFNTLPYYITDLFIIAYRYSRVVEGMTPQDILSTRSRGCSFNAAPLPSQAQ